MPPGSAIQGLWPPDCYTGGMSSKRKKSTRQRGGFQPPHCPNPDCDFHVRHPDWRFVKNGHYTRVSDGRVIQKYICRHCNRHFSTTTFNTNYWLRRRDLLLPIARMICEGAGLRQIARVLGTSHSTVARHVARLGRHCLLYHHNLLHEYQLREAIVVDGFETFEYSQYFPFHINFAAGSESWFLYNFTDSPLRRKGRMTGHQKRRRAELESRLGRPDPKAVELGMADLVRPLLKATVGERLCLHSDDHPAYPRALERLVREESEVPPLSHQITSSKVRRTQSNPLFPVNLVDLLVRHSNANHRRETIAFSKRRQAAMERAAVFTVWRNCVKRRSENGPRKSAAMWVGLLDRLLSWRQVLRRRLFPGHADLPRVWVDYYWRRVKTRIFGDRQTTHVCRYAI